MALIGDTFFNKRNGTSLFGTNEDDDIFGWRGDDSLYGGAGNDTMYGGIGKDYISASNNKVIGNWGRDTAFGGSGDDTLDFVQTTVRVDLYGGSGTDMIFGGSGGDFIDGGSEWDWLQGNGGADRIEGGGGDDLIWGGAQKDHLFGESGKDTLDGGSGNDKLSGGIEKDFLTGGSGADNFVFLFGDTKADSTRDVITDWNSFEDFIEARVAGTDANYGESTIGLNAGFSAAMSRANSMMHTKDYVFVTDMKNSWLFADLNGDAKADTAIEFTGITSVERFASSDIVQSDMF